MGLRCLIGHDYGEPRTARDQKARGNEVVVTVREYRECARCGRQRVISENKEIKVGSPAEPAPEAPTEPDWSSDDPTGDASTGGADPLSTAGAALGGGDAVEPLTAEEDDGIILEDEPDEPTRAPGEWPDDGREVPDEGAADAGSTADSDTRPDQAGEDADAAPSDTEEAGGVEFGGSLAPEELDEAPGDESADGDAPGDDTEIIDAEAHVGDPTEAAGTSAPTGATGGADAPDDHPEPAEGERAEPRQRPDGRDTEFVCPECGETWPAVNASLRPGDICPECRRGYLTEQVAQ